MAFGFCWFLAFGGFSLGGFLAFVVFVVLMALVVWWLLWLSIYPNSTDSTFLFGPVYLFFISVKLLKITKPLFLANIISKIQKNASKPEQTCNNYETCKPTGPVRTLPTSFQQLPKRIPSNFQEQQTTVRFHCASAASTTFDPS